MAELLIIIISLALGSFANTMISYYLGESEIDIKRSKCYCGKKYLKISQLIPLISFIASKGKCTFCKKTIPLRYFVVEFLFMASGILSLLKFGASFLMAINFLCFSLLIIIAVIDFYRFIIPNALVLAILVLSVLKLVWFHNSVIPAIASSVFIGLFFIAVNIFMRKVKQKDAIGYGDIKLLSALMIMINIPVGFIALWISAFTAIPGFYIMKLTIKRFADEARVPFGMFISLGFIMSVLLEENILPFCFNMAGI